ncbi:MAG: damage-control phosphatase ARMT1 family protein [Thermoproteota archaeon]
MKPSILCIPCTVNAAYDIASKATGDEEAVRRILFEVLRWLPKAIEDNTLPNVLHTHAQRITQTMTGVKDPFKHLKKVSNDVALRIYPSLKKIVYSTSNPLEALRLSIKSSIIGNMIDFEVHGHRPSLDDLESCFRKYLDEPLIVDDVAKLFKLLRNGSRVLYLADNAGEIVFDKLVSSYLKEMLGCGVTMVVKGGPVLNDATLEDAEYIALKEACDEVITTGDDTIGVMMNRVSEDFKRALRQAEVVVSKGQGNFESLTEIEEEISKPVCYVLRVKCAAVGRYLGVPHGSNVVKLVNA